MESGRTAFWRTKTLDQMTPEEWESLCDGCARCCLLKLEDEDTGDIYLTRLTCSLLDLGQCRCSDYENRQTVMPDCVSIDPEKIKALAWMPKSCAYRRLSEGRDLAWWHHLVSGSHETVHEVGISVRSWARSEKGISKESLERYIIDDLEEE